MESERHVDWLYMYGIVRDSVADLPSVEGVEGRCDVSLIRHRDLACAVSPVPDAEYSHEALVAHAVQSDWLAPRAVRHQQVVHRLKEMGAVVPLRFGTLCANSDDLCEFLEVRRQSLLQLLGFFQDREEWGVRIFLDPDLTERAVVQDSSTTDEIASVSPGEAYFLRKKKQKLAGERVAIFAAELEDEMRAHLSRYAADVRKGRPLSSPSSPARLLVLNAALLVDQDKATALAEAIGRLEADYHKYGVTSELSGPWAPYSFCEGAAEAPRGPHAVWAFKPCGS